MPKIYPGQEQENKTKQLEADIIKVFSKNSKIFCLTSLMVELTKKGKRYPREDIQDKLKLFEKEGKIIQKDRFPPNGKIYYRWVKH